MGLEKAEEGAGASSKDRSKDSVVASIIKL